MILSSSRCTVLLTWSTTRWTHSQSTRSMVGTNHRVYSYHSREGCRKHQCAEPARSNTRLAEPRLELGHERVDNGTGIGLAQFEAALRRAWTSIASTEMPMNAPSAPPHRIGVAVSGGVDSMALAALCAKLRDQTPDMYHFHAIIVDHQARPGSREEAVEVARLLSCLEIASSIQTVSWPSGEEAVGQEHNFETRARRQRYQLLGQACLAQQLRYLLIAHHADDQAETVLGRIISGKTGPGLRGIKPSARIPENEGIWGVSEGSRKVPFDPRLSNKMGKHTLQQSVLHGPQFAWSKARSLMASEGITIHRPLLEFSKGDLASTCKSLGVSWKEDKTNQDVTLTPRNTVRSLLAGGKLPAALRRTSLLRLQASMRMNELIKDDASVDALESVDIEAFDPRSGALQIALHPQSLLSNEDLQSLHTHERGGQSAIIARVTQNLASIVTPRQSLDPAQDAEHLLEAMHAKIRGVKAAKFNSSGVQWQRLPGVSFNDTKAVQKWTLSREVPPRNSLSSSCSWTRLLADGIGEPFGTWQLFDTRYWISVLSDHFPTLVVRFATRKEIQDMRRRSSMLRRSDLCFMPSERIWETLPALAESHSSPILALPSVNAYAKDSQEKLSWRWVYRNIDLGPHLARKQAAAR